MEKTPEENYLIDRAKKIKEQWELYLEGKNIEDEYVYISTINTDFQFLLQEIESCFPKISLGRIHWILERELALILQTDITQNKDTGRLNKELAICQNSIRKILETDEYGNYPQLALLEGRYYAELASVSWDRKYNKILIDKEVLEIMDAKDKIAFYLKKKREFLDEKGDMSFNNCVIVPDCRDFDVWCDRRIQELIEEESAKAGTVSVGKYRIRKGQKTNFVKIINSMILLKMFEENDLYISNKQKLFDAFGEFFGEDFSTYSTLLSQDRSKKDEGNFLKTFDDLKEEAKKYYEKDIDN